MSTHETSTPPSSQKPPERPSSWPSGWLSLPFEQGLLQLLCRKTLGKQAHPAFLKPFWAYQCPCGHPYCELSGLPQYFQTEKTLEQTDWARLSKKLGPVFYLMPGPGDAFLIPNLVENILPFAQHNALSYLHLKTHGEQQGLIVDTVKTLLAECPETRILVELPAEGLFPHWEYCLPPHANHENSSDIAQHLDWETSCQQIMCTYNLLKELSQTHSNLELLVTLHTVHHKQETAQQFTEVLVNDWQPHQVLLKPVEYDRLLMRYQVGPDDTPFSDEDLAIFSTFLEALEPQKYGQTFGLSQKYLHHYIWHFIAVWIAKRLWSVRALRHLIGNRAAVDALVILPDGAVYDTEALTGHLGTLTHFEYDLSLVWQSYRSKALQKRLQKRFIPSFEDTSAIATIACHPFYLFLKTTEWAYDRWILPIVESGWVQNTLLQVDCWAQYWAHTLLPFLYKPVLPPIPVSNSADTTAPQAKYPKALWRPLIEPPQGFLAHWRQTTPGGKAREIAPSETPKTAEYL